MPQANGRLLRKPVVTLIPTADGLRVRIDDDGWPEFWCEVVITTAELCIALIHATELNNPELASALRKRCVVEGE